MEIEGKLIKVLPERTGVSKTTGEPWRIASYVLEIPGYHPQKMMFEVSDGSQGRIAQLNLQLGQHYKIQFDIDAREDEGRWFNSVRAWGAKLITYTPEEATR